MIKKQGDQSSTSTYTGTFKMCTIFSSKAHFTPFQNRSRISRRHK